MKLQMHPLPSVDARWPRENAPRAGLQDTYVCWSRMQAEAGQPIEEIVARKEVERQAGNGLFFWGVGNAPAAMINDLARLNYPVEAIFSIMKTRPKAIDVSPSRTVVWRRYFDAEGVERPLPENALVTSRGDSATGAKKMHYALMCKSDVPLRLERGSPFDPSAFRNAGGAGAPVGASQVTALLRRVGECSTMADYEANMRAWLHGSYWVRLTDPLELDASKLALLTSAGDGGADTWCEAVRQIRSGPRVRDRQGALL